MLPFAPVLKALLLSLGLSSGLCAIAQPVVVKKDESLRAEPSDQAAGPNVAANSKGEITDRRGFWIRVRTASGEGWMKLSAVSVEQAGAGGSGSSALAGLASGRTGGGNIVSTSGTRGLSDAELKSARPDRAALDRLKKSAVGDEAARQFSGSGGLQARQIAPLPAPASTQAQEPRN